MRDPVTRQRIRQITLADVAREAGVSLATASRALNGSERVVGDDLRSRVEAAAAALGYQPNVQAQAMARGHADIVGLVVPDITDQYFSAIASGAMTCAEQAGLTVLLGNTIRRPEREVDHVATLRGQRGRGIILVGSRTSSRSLRTRLMHEIAAYEQVGGRVVAISQPTLAVDTIHVDNRALATSLATALLDRGYRRFAILSTTQRLLTSRERADGFTAGLRARRVAAPTVVRGDFTRDGGHAAMSQLLDSGDRPDCVFAVADVMAIGALAACRERGLRVPEDLGMAGFGGVDGLQDVQPHLTTVRLPLAQLGRLAVELVLAEPAEPRRVELPGEILVRESTPGPA